MSKISKNFCCISFVQKLVCFPGRAIDLINKKPSRHRGIVTSGTPQLDYSGSDNELVLMNSVFCGRFVYIMLQINLKRTDIMYKPSNQVCD